VSLVQSELLTLSRDNYDTILKIQKTPEMKERVKFLKVATILTFSFLWIVSYLHASARRIIIYLTNVAEYRSVHACFKTELTALGKRFEFTIIS
jgi:hypothetical protein